MNYDAYFDRLKETQTALKAAVNEVYSARIVLDSKPMEGNEAASYARQKMDEALKHYADVLDGLDLMTNAMGSIIHEMIEDNARKTDEMFRHIMERMKEERK